MASVVLGEIFAMDPAAFAKATRGAPSESLARQILVHVVNVALAVPEEAIAEAIGRDVTTVMHSNRLIEEMRDRPDFDQALDWIGERLVEFTNFRQAYARGNQKPAPAQSPRAEAGVSSKRSGTKR